MKLTTAINLENISIQRIKDIYSTAEIMSLTSAEINDRIHSNVYMELKNRKAPRWIESFCKGYERALRDALYKDKLVFGAFINGRFYSTERNSPDYYEKHDISAIQFNTEGINGNSTVGHYWKHSQKPYFNGK